MSEYAYEFIGDVMTDGSIPKKERKKFYYNVALPYINDDEFRKKVHSKYVVFVSGRLTAIVMTPDDAINYPEKGPKFIYYLGDDQPALPQF
jgi:hypothetical protein